LSGHQSGGGGVVGGGDVVWVCVYGCACVWVCVCVFGCVGGGGLTLTSHGASLGRANEPCVRTRARARARVCVFVCVFEDIDDMFAPEKRFPTPGQREHSGSG